MVADSFRVFDQQSYGNDSPSSGDFHHSRASSWFRPGSGINRLGNYAVALKKSDHLITNAGAIAFRQSRGWNHFAHATSSHGWQ
jgi:hypothetical protein